MSARIPREEELFDEARQLPDATQRSAFLARTCSGNPTLHARLTGLLEANLAVTSNQLNQVMKKMTSWGAILIVATLIAGIYGMNFRHMPELDWTYGYPIALAAMVVICGSLYALFRRSGWL